MKTEAEGWKSSIIRINVFPSRGFAHIRDRKGRLGKLETCHSFNSKRLYNLSSSLFFRWIVM